MQIKFILCTALLMTSYFVSSQISINEYSASNLIDFADNFAKYEDWIELYNDGDEPVNLKGWYLSDKETKPTKWEITSDLMISSKGYAVFWCSGRDSINNDGAHTNFKLTQTKGNEVLVLTMPDETVVDVIPMEITALGHSRNKIVDGGDTWKVSTTPTLATSNNDATMYKSYAGQLLMSHDAGFYSETQKVTLSTSLQNVNIHYTTNGNAPTENDPIYNEGDEIVVGFTSIVKARAFSTDPEILPGKIVFNTFFINESFTVPVFSVGADEIQDLANGQGALRPQGSLEYFNAEGEREALSYGELNRHGQDSWILPHRSLDWISRDEMGYNRTVEAKLFNYSDRDDYQRFMFRASGDDNYPANGDFNHQGSCHIRDEYVHTLAHNGNMKLDIRAVERVVVFLNGEYWGLYGLRERPVDHDYTSEYYDQDKYNLQYLATWGNTWAEYGGDKAFEDWGELRDFILNNDMFLEANYQIVKDNMQVKSLCDYMIVNLNTVASDWLNYNTGWWRGIDPEGDHKKWGYILWDNDATFDYYINYSGVPNTDPDALPCDIDEISDFMDGFFNNDVGKHEKIFLKMLDESDEFRQLYYSRQADMLNEVFSCENMISTFDSMIATITPEMPRQIDRWGGSMQEWESNVQTMREFIEARCTLIDTGMVSCYNLTGPYEITLDVEPAGAGEIEFNTLDIEQFPWSGNYFGSMPNLIEAKATDPDESFMFWKTKNGSVISPDSTLAEAQIFFDQVDTLIAVFGVQTALEEVDEISSIGIYPTVFTDQFSLQLDIIEASIIHVELIDMKGSVVQDFPALNRRVGAGDYHWTVTVNTNLAEGMYFLRLTTEKGISTTKIFKAN